MPLPGRAWFHVMWHTYGTWLPGDDRGFRDRDHRIHSSGDYKNRPPEGEHSGLHDYAKRVSKNEVVLRTPEQRREVCDALLQTIREMKLRVLVVTVCRVHVHLVIELPDDNALRHDALTKLKMNASKRVKNKPASRLWARLWKVVSIKDEMHRDEELRYARDRQGRYVCTWTSRDGFVKCN